MVAMIAVLWAYDGWNDLTMVAGEVKRPERSLPLALIAGLFIVGALYMATNAAIQYILPAAQIAAAPRPAVAAMAVVSGHAGAILVSAAMALSIFVTLNGTIMSGARVPFAAATGPAVLPQHRAHSSAISEPVDFSDCAGSAQYTAAAWLSAGSSSFLSWLSLPNGFFI